MLNKQHDIIQIMQYSRTYLTAPERPAGQGSESLHQTEKSSSFFKKCLILLLFLGTYFCFFSFPSQYCLIWIFFCLYVFQQNVYDYFVYVCAC